ncbi:TetR/AcrR family transcriptional regulator [Paenibacillus qinlingensis]|uniref:TetR/AcrR family transcriptional regulator n=1 Tax=Paenibacillus qinlingensis TaxID=1837343 RepID=UPI001566A664|nr:TetR/AcrR family transcriptional regulator [Paenibacillus qinlingensis]NQX61314.1 TetR/AcrR family transcriptional regulator [Paenibacillus qinlingensis]
MTKNKFQLKREATYQLLVEAGMMCFSEKGYAATTLGDIVARTGHTKGAFYGHFTSKEMLFMHVLNYQIQITDGWAEIPKQFNPKDTSLEEVLSITLTRLGQMLKGLDKWIVVLIDFYQQTKHDPEIHSMLKHKYREWIAGIEALVNTLQVQGWIAPDKDVRLIAMQVIAFNEGYAVFSLLFGGTDPIAHIKGLVKLMS